MNKKWLIIAAVLMGVAIVTLGIDYVMEKKNGQDVRIGQTLLTQEQILSIDAVVVKKGKKELKLTKDADNAWQLPSEGDFPVDAKKLVDFLDNLNKYKFLRVMTQDKSKFNEFGVELPEKPDSPPSEKTVYIQLMAKDKAVIELKVGDIRANGGQYLSINDEAKVYLVDNRINFEVEPSSWELKTLLNVKKEDIASMEFQPTAINNTLKPVKIAWEEPPPPTSETKSSETKYGETKTNETTKTAEAATTPPPTEPAKQIPVARFKVTSLTENEKEKESALSGIESAFSDLRYTKRFQATDKENSDVFQKAMANARHAILNLKDGRSYDLIIGHAAPANAGTEKDKPKDDKGRYFVKITASKSPNSPGDVHMEKNITRLNKLMEQHMFEISSYQAEKLLKTREDFIEMPAATTAKKDEKSAPKKK